VARLHFPRQLGADRPCLAVSFVEQNACGH
jgi:hypothetical protein